MADKVHKQEVHYHTTTGSDHCGVCRFYRGNGDCEKVIEKVTPNGWCELFKRRSRLKLRYGEA